MLDLIVLLLMTAIVVLDVKLSDLCPQISLEHNKNNNSSYLFCAPGLPWWLRHKGSAWNAGDPGSIPELGRAPGKGNGYPLQYSCWRIPWTEEPGGLLSMGSQRIGHDWATNTFTLLSVSNGFKFIEVDAVVLILKLKKTWGPERLSNLPINM